MKSRFLDRIRNFFSKPRKKMTFGDLEKSGDPEYTVSWDDKFNDAVIHQLKEIPSQYKEHWRKDQELSTQAFREMLEEKKKKRDKELTRVEQ